MDTSGLNRQVAVVCDTMMCTNIVCTTNSAVAAHNGKIYCERCRLDRKSQMDREYEERRTEIRNARKRIDRPDRRFGPKPRVRGGRKRRGPGAPQTISDEQIAEIRQRFEARKPWSRVDSGPQLAEEFGISLSYFYEIVKGKVRV